MNRKIRTAIVTLIAAFSVAVAIAPTDAHARVKSNPTGNSELDAICQKFADLINAANVQGDLASIDGDDESAQAWYDLADEGIRRATAAGCKLSARVLPGVRTDGLQVSPGNTTTGTKVKVPVPQINPAKP